MSDTIKDKNSLLTISQLAKLRNININSLRYYEKLGIFCPAFIDPQTKYRYYSLEQLHMLDIILLCIDLNIPLKQLTQFTYRDSVKLRELLEEGKQIAEQQYKEKLIELRKIEYLLNFLEKEQNTELQASTYHREISSRCLIAAEYHGDLRDIERVQRSSAKLLLDCPTEYHPTFMAGILLDFSQNDVRQYVFYELVDKVNQDKPNIIQLPKGNYHCHRVEMEKSTCDYYDLIEKNFGKIYEGMVIISFAVQSSMQLETSYREIQILDK